MTLRSPGTGRRALTLILGNLAVLVAILVLLEIAALVFVPRELSSLFSNPDLMTADRPFVEAHPVRGFSLKPGFVNELYRVNESGFRGPELPADLQDRFVIFAFGESTTFGWDVEEGQDFPSHLQVRLNEFRTKRPFAVVNAGVPSYTSAQVLLYVREVLERYEPDLVVITILWNDIWFSALGNWYPEALVFQQPPRWSRFLLRHSGLYRSLVIRPLPPTEQRDLFNEAAFAAYQEHLAEILRLCKNHDVPVALVESPFEDGHMPERGISPFGQIRLTKPFFIEVSKTYMKAAAEIASQHGVPMIDHRMSLNYSKPFELFSDALHPVGAANTVMAEDLALALRGAGLLAGADRPRRDRPTHPQE